MNIKRIVLLMILLLTMPILAACGGDDDGGGGDAAALSQSYDEAGLSFNYPEGWIAVADSGGALVGNSEEVLDAVDSGGDAEVPDGGQAYTILGFPAPAESGMEPAQMVEAFAAEQAGEDGTEMGDPEDVTIGDASGVKVTVSDEASKGEGAFYILRLNDAVMVAVIGIASEGDYDDALTQAIAATVSYAPPE